jgi:cell division septum initiation protein DivIVA
LQLIDQLEELFDEGWRVPLSRKVAVDEDAFLNIVDQMRITIPQEIKQARKVRLERDKYIAQAHEEARRIIAQAREDAAKQLDDHQLKEAARAEAEEIIEAAREDARHIRAGADDYAEAKLMELARSVGQLQQVLRNGLDALGRRRGKLREGEMASDEVLTDQEQPEPEAVPSERSDTEGEQD